MIDIIIRDCGRGEFLPIITATDSGKELYRGSRVASREVAFDWAKMAWDKRMTCNITEFRKENEL